MLGCAMLPWQLCSRLSICTCNAVQCSTPKFHHFNAVLLLTCMGKNYGEQIIVRISYVDFTLLLAWMVEYTGGGGFNWGGGGG